MDPRALLQRAGHHREPLGEHRAHPVVPAALAGEEEHRSTVRLRPGDAVRVRPRLAPYEGVQRRRRVVGRGGDHQSVFQVPSPERGAEEQVGVVGPGVFGEVVAEGPGGGEERLGGVAGQRQQGGGLPAVRRAGAGVGASSRITWAFVPPIPMECTPARRGRPSSAGQGRGRVGRTKGLPVTSRAGLGRVWFTSGGISPWRSTSTALISPASPAALSRWPIADFVEPSAQKPVRSVCSRNASVRAANSIGSPLSVPVPCASK